MENKNTFSWLKEHTTRSIFVSIMKTHGKQLDEVSAIGHGKQKYFLIVNASLLRAVKLEYFFVI
jgi:hypothetical protein